MTIDSQLGSHVLTVNTGAFTQWKNHLSGVSLSDWPSSTHLTVVPQPQLYLLPSAKEVAGRECVQSCLSVILSTGMREERLHVTITNDASDFTKKEQPLTCSNLFIMKHVRLLRGRLASYSNAFLYLQYILIKVDNKIIKCLGSPNDGLFAWLHLIKPI